MAVEQIEPFVFSDEEKFDAGYESGSTVTGDSRRQPLQLRRPGRALRHRRFTRAATMVR